MMILLITGLILGSFAGIMLVGMLANAKREDEMRERMNSRSYSHPHCK